MHVVFLDFDGPMFPTKMCLFPQNDELLNEYKRKEIGLDLELYKIWKMDDFAVIVLNKLYEYFPFEIVVSSNWGNGNSKQTIQKLLDANGITVPLAQDYRLAKINMSRLERISDYIKRNKVRNYIAIDDYDSCPDMVEPELVKCAELSNEKLFCIDFDNGISLKNFRDMRTQICKWS